MSIGSLGGIAGSAAGAPSAQTKGPEPERSENDATSQQRRAEGDRKAEAAAGIGETDGDDHEAAERDADGRRPWEVIRRKQQTDPAQDTLSRETPQSKDASGQSGAILDLSG